MTTGVSNAERIAFIDGMRGIAIIAVVLFHAYARWPALLPFGDQFRFFPISWGRLGVQFFFIISGFVIFLTLDRSRSWLDFLTRRWVRLFPAMLWCSLTVLLTGPLLLDRPAGAPHAAQLLPGLTFIGPQWWSLAGVHTQSIEGAFWSLYVEVHFYIIAGAAYFLSNRRSHVALAAVLAIFALGALSGPLGASLLADTMNRVGAGYFGWFAAGALFFAYHRTGQRWALCAAMTVGVLAMAVDRRVQGMQGYMVAASLLLIFAGSLSFAAVRSFLSSRFLLTMGFISYPLYLNHENTIVSMTIQLGRAAPGIPSVLLPVVPIVLASLVAYLAARFVEPWAKSALSRRPSYPASLSPPFMMPRSP
jgi:peptidoglycan/LPS O-acetylase OafA/YrhL